MSQHNRSPSTPAGFNQTYQSNDNDNNQTRQSRQGQQHTQNQNQNSFVNYPSRLPTNNPQSTITPLPSGPPFPPVGVFTTSRIPTRILPHSVATPSRPQNPAGIPRGAPSGNVVRNASGARSSTSLSGRPAPPVTPASDARPSRSTIRTARIMPDIRPRPSILPTTPTNQGSTGQTVSGRSYVEPSTLQMEAARNAVQANNRTRQLPRGTPEHGREALAQFLAITNHIVAPVRAMNFMQRTSWNLNAALDMYMAQQEGEQVGPGQDLEDDDDDDDEWDFEKGKSLDVKHSLGDLQEDKKSGETSAAKSTPRPKKEHKLYLDENEDVDRTPARRGLLEPSKQTITLTLDGEQRTFQWSREVGDWNSADEIERLNRWRQQIFRKFLGTVRSPVAPYEPEENQWIIDTFAKYKKDESKINWNTEVKAFNDRFEGRTLPNARVNPRPPRSKGSLMTQSHRIPEVGQLTGLKVRGKRHSVSSSQAGHKRDASGTNIDPTETKNQKRKGTKKANSTTKQRDVADTEMGDGNAAMEEEEDASAEEDIEKSWE